MGLPCGAGHLVVCLPEFQLWLMLGVGNSTQQTHQRQEDGKRKVRREKGNVFPNRKVGKGEEERRETGREEEQRDGGRKHTGWQRMSRKRVRVKEKVERWGRKGKKTSQKRCGQHREERSPEPGELFCRRTPPGQF